MLIELDIINCIYVPPIEEWLPLPIIILVFKVKVGKCYSY